MGIIDSGTSGAAVGIQGREDSGLDQSVSYGEGKKALDLEYVLKVELIRLFEN